MPVKIAYAILAHENPALVGRLASLLLKAGGIVAIHYDVKGGEAAPEKVMAAMPEGAGDILWAPRVSVGWGEWSIIEATLNCVRTIFEAGHQPDYIHLMSGSDYPIRPVADFHDFLERAAGTDFLESRDMASNRWVVDGLTHERYRYRHYFNWKQHPHLFDWSWKLQRKLKMRRRLPKDLKPHMGSQWCTLSGDSWSAILALSKRKDVIDAFRLSWIPDEMYIQTLLASVKPPPLSSRCLTLYQFTGQGVPVVYYNGHAPYLASQPFYFARKISPHADRLRDDLNRLVSGEMPVTPFTDLEIGIRTTQYDSFRQARRQPQAGRRTMGHVKDPWYGDLEWNEQPYIVFMGTSVEEVEWVSTNLPGGRFACHGALFAEERIGFMGGAARFAGYRDTDVPLRDHKRTNFLSDVIQSSPGQITSFALPWGSDEYIRDVVRYDKRAHVVLVRGNTMRAMLEQAYPRHWTAVKSAAAGDTAVEPISIPPEEFRDFYDRYEEYYAERWSQLGSGGAKWIEIDILNVGWRRHLGDFLARIDAGSRENAVNLGYVLAGSPAIHAPLSDPADAVRNISDNYAQIGNPDRRSNHLDRILTRIARPYAVIIGASREELGLARSLLERTGAFACHGALFNSELIEFAGGAAEVSGYNASDVGRRDRDPVGFFSAVMRRSDDKYAGFIIEWLAHPTFFERIVRDRQARIMVLHGNQLRSFVEYAGDAADVHGFEEFSRAHHRYFKGLLDHLEAAGAAYSELDLLSPDFADDLRDYLNGIDDRLLQRLPSSDDPEIASQIAQLSNPATGLDNASYLYRRIADQDRRSIHSGITPKRRGRADA